MSEMRTETVREARRKGVDKAEEETPQDRQKPMTAEIPKDGTQRDPDPATGEHDLRSDQRVKGGSTGSSG